MRMTLKNEIIYLWPQYFCSFLWFVFSVVSYWLRKNRYNYSHSDTRISHFPILHDILSQFHHFSQYESWGKEFLQWVFQKFWLNNHSLLRYTFYYILVVFWADWIFTESSFFFMVSLGIKLFIEADN